ncbi:MAG: hypothetical protein R3Y33_03640, partial [Clostridia bacterium]
MTLAEIDIKTDSMLFATGAVSYPILEILWRGYSHFSMAIAGGLCLVFINKFCCEKFCDKPMYLRCSLGSLIITSIELIVGLIVNKVFFLNVWDYSTLPFNVLGQICLPFSLAWFFICIPAMYICKKISQYSKR